EQLAREARVEEQPLPEGGRVGTFGVGVGRVTGWLRQRGRRQRLQPLEDVFWEIRSGRLWRLVVPARIARATLERDEQRRDDDDRERAAQHHSVTLRVRSSS